MQTVLSPSLSLHHYVSVMIQLSIPDPSHFLSISKFCHEFTMSEPGCVVTNKYIYYTNININIYFSYIHISNYIFTLNKLLRPWL